MAFIYKVFFITLLLLLIGTSSLVSAQEFNPNLYQNLSWRCIGPFRAGRTVGATGIPNQPNVFYAGVNHGGVWKTNDYGRTWKPIFDSQPTGSIGDLAVSPSNPNIIYVGSGEGLQRPDLSVGDGVYKSTDGGKTWKNMGLKDGQQIGSVIVDPQNPNRVFVAVLGHPYGANTERGVFRSLNGGETWEKVLYKDENTGAIQVAFDPKNPQIIYTDLWAARQGPWENGSWQGSGSGLYKSTDGGTTWKQLNKGLPTFEQDLGRIGFAIAPSNPNRLYATVDSSKLGGLYRSDDGGETWQRLSDDGRLWGRGSDFAEVKVHPQNPDIVYVANICTYRSNDGGKTFTAIKGAPGGDDYHRIWINPNNPDIILLASDQGVVITVNGGETWSSWYNQPTAQFYHVITDNQFPYWVYGGQQESGSAAVISRGDYGAITWRDFITVGAEEYGYIAPDPLNPNIIYGGKLTRFDRTTGQAQNIAPEAIRSGKYRFLRTAPVIFSPVDPHVLYYAGNVLFKTTTGGNSWDIISPDLSREQPSVPENIGVYRKPEMATMPRRGVIYTVAPSFKDVNTIWVGTDDGLIHITHDGGKSWQNITPPELSSWSKVSLMEASHFDNETAYAAINRFRLDDLHPHIYRTHDGGKTWQEIVKGIPNNEVVNAIREDPLRKGLLFAGTERAVYVSFNDGQEWQALRLNMPSTSIRDLVVHNDDIIVGTHGRSFWILDNITSLRQLNEKIAKSEAFLFNPQLTHRIRRSTNTDTPIPPEEPMGQNPPDGAIIDYYLQEETKEPVVLEIFDSSNKLVRRFSSSDKPEEVNEQKLNIPTYWIRPSQVLSNKAGIQRFVWDLHYAPPPGIERSYPISAIYRNTPSEPLGPNVLPGEYTIKLTINGKIYQQTLTVKMDPRVKITTEGLTKMFDTSMENYQGLIQLNKLASHIHYIQEQLKTIEPNTQGEIKESIAKLSKDLYELESGHYSSGTKASNTTPNINDLTDKLAQLLGTIEEVDAVPTTQLLQSSKDLQDALKTLLADWEFIKEKEIKPLHEKLQKSNLVH